MKKSRKPYYITGALLIYAIVMAIYNLDTLTVYHEYLRYFGTLAAELVVLTALFFFLRKREALKAERQEDMRRAANTEKEA